MLSGEVVLRALESKNLISLSLACANAVCALRSSFLRDLMYSMEETNVSVSSWMPSDSRRVISSVSMIPDGETEPCRAIELSSVRMI